MSLFSIDNVNPQKILASLEEEEADPKSRKRKKLDDFTHEERIVRRKLKNRIAAQTARDRKKEQMSHLETIVLRLESSNKELKQCNLELQQQVHYLTKQNEMLRSRLGLTPPMSPQQDEDIIDGALLETKIDKQKVSTPVVPDIDHILIKTEEEFADGHAWPGISPQKKMQILLVSLITMWLASPRLNNYLISLSTSSQDKFLKSLLRRKLQAKLTRRPVQASLILDVLCRQNLAPLLRACLEKKLQNCSPCVMI